MLMLLLEAATETNTFLVLLQTFSICGDQAFGIHSLIPTVKESSFRRPNRDRSPKSGTWLLLDLGPAW